MLTDTHCHLNFEKFDADRDEVLERAREVGLTNILNPGIDAETCREAIALADAHPEVYAAVGLHPNRAGEWSDTLESQLRTWTAHPKVVAIGEIGLDYYWNTFPHDLQQQVLNAQLSLAAEVELPVIIHNRESTDDVVAMLIAWQKTLVAAGNPLAARPGVVHSFSGNVSHATNLLTHNYYVGITGPVTFKKADELRDVVREVPLSRLLIETDAPFLSPHPKRGKRNEPAHVRFVAEKISEIKHIPVEHVIDITYQNANHLFGWN